MPPVPLRRVLLVEDDPDIQAVAKLALEAIGGYEVRLCGSGSQAVEEAAGFAPDLILLDVMMPDMDGPATLRALRNIPQISQTPVVFMTAKVQPYEVASIKEMGAIDVISKPFDPMTLSTIVGRIWSQHYG
jgi:two-component system OmpR family response regulator